MVASHLAMLLHQHLNYCAVRGHGRRTDGAAGGRAGDGLRARAALLGRSGICSQHAQDVDHQGPGRREGNASPPREANIGDFMDYRKVMTNHGASVWGGLPT